MASEQNEESVEVGPADKDASAVELGASVSISHEIERALGTEELAEAEPAAAAAVNMWECGDGAGVGEPASREGVMVMLMAVAFRVSPKAEDVE